MPKKKEQISKEPKRVFANRQTRIGFETVEAVVKLDATMPVVGSIPRLVEISTEQVKGDDLTRSLAAIFAAGTVVPTGEKHRLYVPPRTLEIMDKLNLRYKRVKS